MIVLDLEMPLCCKDCCGFTDNYDYPTCMFTHLSAGYTFKPQEKRMENCPIVCELKNPGELIYKEQAIDAVSARLEKLRHDPVFMRKRGDIDLAGVFPYINTIDPVITIKEKER